MDPTWTIQKEFLVYSTSVSILMHPTTGAEGFFLRKFAALPTKLSSKEHIDCRRDDE